MKKLFILTLLAALPLLSQAQSCSPGCDPKSCDPKSCDKGVARSCVKTCGPEGTKTKEAVVITTMRTDLQTIITRISKALPLDTQVAGMKIEQGESDDESLLYLSQAATSIRHELLMKIEPGKLVAALKNYQPSSASTRQQMVSALKKEIQLLANQAEKL